MAFLTRGNNDENRQAKFYAFIPVGDSHIKMPHADTDLCLYNYVQATGMMCSSGSQTTSPILFLIRWADDKEGFVITHSFSRYDLIRPEMTVDSMVTEFPFLKCEQDQMLKRRAAASRK
jgi:hypothetical protein